MPFRILAACVAAVALAAQPVCAETPDEALVADFAAAVNGAPAARAAFLERHVAAAPMMPRPEFDGVLESLARAGGEKTVASWIRSRPDQLRLFVTAGARTARVDLHFAPAEAGKLQGLQALAVPTPYDGPKVSGPLPRAELADAIDRRVRFAAGRDEFSGAVLVVKDGTPIYAQAFGQADKAAGRPNTLETRFNLGSMDKQFTAVAIGQLIERGELTLDTRLIEVLPDYPNPEAARAITIRHLLSHQAGLGMMFERSGWSPARSFASHAEMLTVFAAEPLQFAPGSRSRYSNEGFAVLGAVVEKVSGRSWYDYVAANVFAPAGMTHTGYPGAQERPADRAVGYRLAETDPFGVGGREPNWDRASQGASFGGGFSTAGDMVRFLQALRAGRLLKPETLALFATQAPGGLPAYGLGFQRRTSGGRTIVGHDGGGPQSGINSDAKMILETGYAYAVLGNYDAPFAQTLGRDIADMLALQD